MHGKQDRQDDGGWFGDGDDREKGAEAWG